MYLNIKYEILILNVTKYVSFQLSRTVMTLMHLFIITDVIRVLHGIGTEREYERNGSKTKLNVISLEADG